MFVENYLQFFPINLFDVSLGFILGLFLWILDKRRRPLLNILAKPPVDFQRLSGRYRIIGLRIRNKRRNHFVMGFLNQTATQCRVSVRILDFETQKEIRTIIARWDTTREPFTPDYQKVDIGLALSNPREIITPGEEITISLAIKKENNDNYHLFNNESYQYQDYGKPDWEIKDDKCILEAKLQSAESDTSRRFLILNKGKALDHFNIVEI